MKKNNIIVFTFLFLIAVFNLSAQTIKVDTTYTVQELIEDVLIQGKCAEVSNIEFSTGTNYGSERGYGIGYFSGGQGNFPMKDGVLLSTGRALSANGPETFEQSPAFLNWPGDADLAKELGIPLDKMYNATYIEFDFTTSVDQIKFNFVFASEEYGQFQCQYADGFAFLLTDTVTGETKNLALVPGTTDPVSVKTIRNTTYNPACDSQNVEYFDRFFGKPGAFGQEGEPEEDSPTNFKGYTKKLKASAPAVPNRKYHIKMVIADNKDPIVDAGIFLEAGSFDLGGGLGEDITIAAGNAICEGGTKTIGSGLKDTIKHTWYKDGVEIVGETKPDLVVSQSGTYSVKIDFGAGSDCIAEDSVIVEFIKPGVVKNTVPLKSCDDETGKGVFDLTKNTVEALGDQDPKIFTVKYFETQAAADAGTPEIATPDNYTGTNGQTIYVRVDATKSGDCFGTGSFQLELIKPSAEFEVTPACDGGKVKVTGIEGGTFTLDPDPGTGVKIDPKTGEVTLGDQNTEYTIKYVITGFCEAESTVTFKTLDKEDPSFTITPTCDGATVVVDGLAGGTFELTPVTAGVSIDAATGTVTGSTYGKTYTIKYTTPGDDLCVNSSEKEFTVLEQDNPAFTLTPSCTGATVEITGGSTGTFAFNPAPPADDTAVIDPATGTITNGTAGETYSVEFKTNGDCIAALIQEVTLLLNPVINEPTKIVNCDDDTDGLTLFDLTTRAEEVLGSLPATEYTISYYKSEADATIPQGAITTPASYTSATATLWVRVDRNGTDCFSLTPLEVEVNKVPLLNEPNPLVKCNEGEGVSFNLKDALSEILGGQTGILITFHETKDGALLNDNSIPDPTNYNTSDSKEIWVRGVNQVTNDCVGVISMQIKISPQPNPNTTAIEACDDDNDGFSVFNLDAEIATIQNGEATTVTYHYTEAAANNGTSIIVDSDKYTNNTQDNEIIYVRVIYPETGCYVVKPLPLKVLPLPEVPLDIKDYELCDDDGDNQAVFDFDTVITPQVIGNQTDVAISYHTSQADAESGNGAITPTNAYQSGDATIYIRLANTENLCSRVGQFNIKVLPMPMAVQPDDLVQCDDQDGDGLAVFDLTVKNSEITGGDNTLKVTYYESPTDSKTLIVDPTAYQSGSPSQTLFVKVGNSEGCFAPVTLTIRTVPNPTPGEPIDLVTCDDGNFDNIGTFDLTVNEAAILNGETGVKVSYHLTRGDANANEKPIADPTNHKNSINNLPVNPQTIYVRVESTESEEGELQCYAVVDFNILVEPQPDFKNDVDPYTACDSDGDNKYPFDLASKTKEILGKESPDSYKVTYHETQEEADEGKNALPDIYTNGAIPLPQTIYVRIESTSGNENCTFTAINFIIDIQDGAEANSDSDPLELMVCDDNIELDGNPANDTAVFDLTTLNEEVLDGQDPATHPVTYYVSYTDAEAGVNPIYAPDQYLSFINPQILYVRVDNNKEDDQGNDLSTCYAVTSLKLMVNPLPPIVLADEYVLCTADNDTTVNESVLLDTGLSTNTFTFQWTKDDDTAVIGSNSTYEPTATGVYTVTATNKNTGCTATVSTNVIPGAPPVVKAEATTFQFAEQHTVVVTASGKDGIVNTKYEFSLDNGPWVRDEATEGSYSFYNVAPGLHEIKVRDIRGCGETVVTIMLLGYPPYFTPNEDSYHDTWNIYGIENFPEAKIHIFDRYGKLLKQISPLGDGWDGTLNGKQLPSTDYWFMVEYIDKKTNNVETFKGHFALKR